MRDALEAERRQRPLDGLALRVEDALLGPDQHARLHRSESSARGAGSAPGAADEPREPRARRRRRRGRAARPSIELEDLGVAGGGERVLHPEQPRRRGPSAGRRRGGRRASRRTFARAQSADRVGQRPLEQRVDRARARAAGRRRRSSCRTQHVALAEAAARRRRAVGLEGVPSRPAAAAGSRGCPAGRSSDAGRGRDQLLGDARGSTTACAPCARRRRSSASGRCRRAGGRAEHHRRDDGARVADEVDERRLRVELGDRRELVVEARLLDRDVRRPARAGGRGSSRQCSGSSGSSSSSGVARPAPVEELDRQLRDSARRETLALSSRVSANASSSRAPLPPPTVSPPRAAARRSARSSGSSRSAS